MSRTLLQVGELALVDRIRSVIGRAGGSGIAEIGPGDDAAVVRSSAGRLVLSIDSQREFVHFERGWLEPRELGQRAAAVALSRYRGDGRRPCLVARRAGPPRCDGAGLGRGADSGHGRDRRRAGGTAGRG